MFLANPPSVQTLPQGGESVTEIMQHHVDAVLSQRRETGVPMFPHINHPNFYYGVSVQDIMDLHGERFFEVYNGHPLVHHYGDSLHPGTEAMWDQINMSYFKKEQPLLLGLATDDSHNYHQFGGAYSNAGRGWVMVLADSLTPRALIKALEAGDFYSSTGVTLKEINYKENSLEISVQAETQIAYTIEFIGATKEDSQSRVLKTVESNNAAFVLKENHLFVRTRVISSKIKTNPFQEGEFESAWTQPVIYQKRH